jgi:hypothetical protein
MAHGRIVPKPWCFQFQVNMREQQLLDTAGATLFVKKLNNVGICADLQISPYQEQSRVKKCMVVGTKRNPVPHFV